MRVRRGAMTIVVSGVVATLLALSTGLAGAQTTTSSSTTSSSTSTSTSTSTTVARTTTSAAATTTSSSTSTTAVPAAATKDDSGLSDTALLLIGAIVVVLLIILLAFLLMRRRAHDQWRDDARGAVSEARHLMQVVTRGLATLDQPAAAAQTWAEAGEHGGRLHSRLLPLLANPPSPQLAAAVSTTDRSLQALRAAVDSDRGLRLGPPPPTESQLSYSEAVVRERATEFDQAVDELSTRLTER